MCFFIRNLILKSTSENNKLRPVNRKSRIQSDTSNLFFESFWIKRQRKLISTWFRSKNFYPYGKKIRFRTPPKSRWSFRFKQSFAALKFYSYMISRSKEMYFRNLCNKSNSFFNIVTFKEVSNKIENLQTRKLNKKMLRATLCKRSKVRIRLRGYRGYKHTLF